MTRRGFLGALLGFPVARFLGPLAKFLPLPATPVRNVRRGMVMDTRAAELRWGEPFERLASLSAPLAELAPAYGDPLGRTVRVSTEDGEIIWEES